MHRTAKTDKNVVVQKLVQEELRQELTKSSDAADTVRLALHDAGTYDLASGTGGLNGSIRFRLESNMNLARLGLISLANHFHLFQ